jgi:hypothetical protein
MVAALVLAAEQVSAPALGRTSGQPSGQEAPAVAKADEGAALRAEVLAVAGRVGVREGTGPTRALKVGDILGAGSEVVTAANSSVRLRVDQSQVFTIEQVGKVMISEAVRSRGGNKTTLAVPYGRVQFEVTSTAISNDVKIAAPDATLAVKGTTGAIEVVSGQPTRAFGGELNRGSFMVDYQRGLRAAITRREATDAKRPDPATNARAEAYVETSDGRAREADEAAKALEYEQLLIELVEFIISEFSQPQQFELFAIDETTRLVAKTNLAGDDEDLFTSETISDTGRGTGLALLNFEEFDSPFILRLESDKGETRLLGVLAEAGRRGLADFQTVATYTSEGQLTGLATVGIGIYAVEDLGERGRIVGLPLQDEKGGSTGIGVVPVVDLGIRLDDGLGGFTRRGTVVAVGRLPDTGLTHGTPGVLGAGAALLEIDPRTNFLLTARSDITGDFAAGPGTIADDGSISTTSRVTGIAPLTFPFVGSFVVLTTESSVGGGPVGPAFVVLGPSALGDGSGPVVGDGRGVLAVGTLDGVAEGLASEGRGRPGGPVALAPPPDVIDATIEPLTAQLGYSLRALGSGVVERIARHAILGTARDAQACRASAALNGNALLAALVVNAQRQSGLGGAVADFRANLPGAHPCQPGDLRGPAVTAPPAAGGPLNPRALGRAFATYRYSRAELERGSVRPIAAEWVAATSRDPAACRASAELSGAPLDAALSRQAGRSGGAAAAVLRFRQALPSSHPCRVP